jgi:hypothetical protein
VYHSNNLNFSISLKFAQMTSPEKDRQIQMLQAYGDGANTIVCANTDANPNACMMEVQKVKGMKCACGFTFAEIQVHNNAQITLIENAFDMIPKSDWVDWNDLDEYFKSKDVINDADERSKKIELMKELVNIMDDRYYDTFTKKLAILMKSKGKVHDLMVTLDTAKARRMLHEHSYRF